MYKHLNKIRISIIFLILFSVFYSFVASQEEEIVFVPYSESPKEIVDDLYNRGYISNKFNYYSILLLSSLLGDIEPGGYSLNRAMGALTLHAKLSEPDYRYVTIPEGVRKEEIADILADKLDWSDEKRKEFGSSVPQCFFIGGEGFFAAGKYLLHKDESIDIIKNEMHKRFLENISEKLGGPQEGIVNLHQAVTIASLIQKEAAGKNDMRLISGIIWNRLFEEIPLQIDATLQFAKGKEGYWWPKVNARDKFIDSPYNTYKNEGLPPGPIATPSMDAVEAAISPSDTDCLFYIHDRSRNIHCSTTYEGHKRNIAYYLK